MYFVSLIKNMDSPYPFIEHNNEDLYLIDNVTTHTILKNENYFSQLTIYDANVSTIIDSKKLIEGFRKVVIFLFDGIKFVINDALFSTKFQRNLLSFKDIRQNGYHIEIVNENNVEYLYIIVIIIGKKCILEKLSTLSFGLYNTNISITETNVIVNQKFTNQNTFIVWHDQAILD